MLDLRRTVLTIAIAVLTVPPVRATDASSEASSLSYALDVNGDLYTLDRHTGSATFVTTVVDGGAGLAIDSQGSMFTISGDSLRLVDTVHGKTTAITAVGNNGYGLAFDGSGALYAGLNFPNALVRIDLATATVTPVGTPAFGPHEFFAGLAIDPTTATMYAMSMRLPTLTGVLYRIDPTDATVTRVGETTAPVTFMVLHFDDSGTLYGASTALETLYTIDTSSGLETEVGRTGIMAYGLASHVGLDAVSPPSHSRSPRP